MSPLEKVHLMHFEKKYALIINDLQTKKSSKKTFSSGLNH